jgi:hypothetical protein
VDFFRFLNPTDPMKMEQGILIPHLKSKMWIERYDQAGEFTFVADVKSGVRDLLPIGSFVSHVDTPEIMIVENHEISDKKDTDAEITISGRGFESDFESRIVGSNKVFPTSGAASEYILDAGYLADQIVTLISNHILAVNLVDDDDALPFVSIVNQVVAAGEQVVRSIKRGTLYERLQELLAVQLLGTKIIRPGVTSPLGGASPNTALVIHKGVDRTAQIVISEDTGEITSADYLWSSKKRKNAALITGRWVETRVVGPETNKDRLWMTVDASDIDQNFETEPVGADLAAIVAAMEQRGREALSAQNDVALTKVDVSKNSNNAAYRTDFNVGDLITVLGSYNSSTTMRISEYVEIEDQTGAQSGPTLSLL